MTYSAIIQELQHIKARLLLMKPVKLESRVQWTGLIGVAQDMWFDRKANKLCKNLIVNNTDYINIPLLLVKRAEELEDYLSTNINIEESISAVVLIQECYNIWNAICPEIAYWTMNEEEWDDYPLPMGLVISYYLYNSFKRFTLPDDFKKEIELRLLQINTQIDQTINPTQDEKSGCLGILLLVAMPTSAFYFLLE